MADAARAELRTMSEEQQQRELEVEAGMEIAELKEKMQQQTSQQTTQTSSSSPPPTKAKRVPSQEDLNRAASRRGKIRRTARILATGIHVTAVVAATIAGARAVLIRPFRTQLAILEALEELD